MKTRQKLKVQENSNCTPLRMCKVDFAGTTFRAALLPLPPLLSFQDWEQLKTSSVVLTTQRLKSFHKTKL